ncbi:hypothetical protein WUBG_18819, partial [Wuchereria bancrofti]
LIDNNDDTALILTNHNAPMFKLVRVSRRYQLLISVTVRLENVYNISTLQADMV